MQQLQQQQQYHHQHQHQLELFSWKVEEEAELDLLGYHLDDEDSFEDAEGSSFDSLHRHDVNTFSLESPNSIQGSLDEQDHQSSGNIVFLKNLHHEQCNLKQYEPCPYNADDDSSGMSSLALREHYNQQQTIGGMYYAERSSSSSSSEGSTDLAHSPVRSCDAPANSLASGSCEYMEDAEELEFTEQEFQGLVESHNDPVGKVSKLLLPTLLTPV